MIQKSTRRVSVLSVPSSFTRTAPFTWKRSSSAGQYSRGSHTSASRLSLAKYCTGERVVAKLPSTSSPARAISQRLPQFTCWLWYVPEPDRSGSDGRGSGVAAVAVVQVMAVSEPVVPTA